MASQRDDLTAALPGYDLAGELGRGGWGVVYEATHRTLERRVAIKELPAAFSSDPSARDRFRSEARTVASLDHPHIVPLYDFVEQGDTCVFVMELMPGGTLWDRFSAGDLTHEASCNITMAVLGALHHAHEHGVLHRDVKPENVLFNAAGMPKLADFGIAKVLGDNAGTRTATGMIMGTPAYMAPEQGSGDPVTPATDLYQVGAMLYELLSGRLPFESTGNPLTQLYRHVHERPEPLHEVAPTIPRPVSEVVMRSLEKAPQDRFTDAAEFASALNAAMNETHGDDWATRSGVRVLATRAMLGTMSTRTVENSPSGHDAAPPSPAPTAMPGTPRPSVAERPAPPGLPGRPAPPNGPTPTSPQPEPTSAPFGSTSPGHAGTYRGDNPTAGHQQAGYQQPSYQQPSYQQPSYQQAGYTHPTSPQHPPATSGSRRGLVVAVVAAVALIGVAITAVVLLGGGDDDVVAQEPVAEPPRAVVTAEARERFEAACDTNGVDPSLCTCALELALEELTPEQFLENDSLLIETGDQITREVLARFNTCQEQFGVGG